MRCCSVAGGVFGTGRSIGGRCGHIGGRFGNRVKPIEKILFALILPVCVLDGYQCQFDVFVSISKCLVSYNDVIKRIRYITHSLYVLYTDPHLV